MKRNHSHLCGLILALFSLASASALALSEAEVDKLFNQALAQSQTGDLAQAISTFETILGERPDAGRVRLELALANYRALNYAAARTEAQRVLDDPSTPDDVRRNIRAFLAEIDKRGRKHLFTPYLAVGWFHDDNVNAGPSSSVVDIGPALLTLSPASLPREDDGIQIQAGLGHQYLLDDSVIFFGHQSAVAWVSSVALFRNQYFDEDDFHLNVVSGQTGIAILAARKFRVQVAGEVNHIMIGDDDIAVYGGFNPSLDIFIGDQWTLGFSGLVQVRDFSRTVDEDRDSEYFEGGAALGFTFPNWPVAIRAGIRGFEEDADTNRRENDGWIVSAGINVRPMDRANVYFNYYHRARNYDGAEPIVLVRRDENEDRFAVGASYPRL